MFCPASLAAVLDAAYYHPVVQLLLRWWSDFGRLVLPTQCAGCAAPDESLCAACRGRICRATVRPYRAEAGAGSLPFLSDRPDAAVLPVVAAGRYRHELARVILAFKNHGRTDLAPVLAATLARAVQYAAAQLAPGPCLLVPVPPRPGSRRRRGYDPLELMLRRLQRRRLLPGGAMPLRAAAVRTRPGARLRGLLAGPSQKGLGRSARRRNVSGSLRVRPRFRRALAGRSCILVDDVLTTGATLAELARVIGEAGGRVAGGVVLAAASAPSGNVAAEDQPVAKSGP
ncbi:ComF family protein [Arthrobacter sp. I2-34]|uniref:ComF family protein n=1 Tax=Arthrobacter hankyongi TaxID=2904801 RepID=A0ABS9L7T9_9MICC|nr:phosphoribosyltransferase family protein [Arthrobacter hankyongi]MCG2622734.1 ComF family protein [Arthrobacter hankyongi]